VTRQPDSDKPLVIDVENRDRCNRTARRMSRRSVTTSRACLDDCDLTNADLSQVDLQGASLERADLTNAILCHARLEGADLAHAVISGTDFRHWRRSGPRSGRRASCQ